MLTSPVNKRAPLSILPHDDQESRCNGAERTFELFVFDLLVDVGDQALDVVVLAVRDEVGEVDWLLAMRLSPRYQPQSGPVNNLIRLL